jgi:GT2 family glycosyltransferase
MNALFPRLGVGALLARLAAADVLCGGHRAETCADCPQGNGRDWCNGECKWLGDRCGTMHEEVMLGASAWTFPPDTRPHGCAKHDPLGNYSDLKVSIIIPWLAEKWEHMEGTLRSLVHFTPDELVEEYLFISDGNPDSREAALKSISPKVNVLALPSRQGLIRAKTQGVEMAKAPVLLFLEAHCIVNRDWLPPLLDRVRTNPRVLAMPSLDIIPPHDFHQYYKGTTAHWRFEWNLNLVNVNPGGALRESAQPIMTPGTSGGIFAMRKDWFQHLGLFDTGMLEWGGDHVELTMKVWRCGGRIEIIPCSRVGHLFRQPAERPYDVEVMQVVRNYARLAQIWYKDHLDIFYKMKPEAVNMKFAGLEEQRMKADKLGCKDMNWYIKNVDVEMAWEIDKVCHPYAADSDPIKCKGSLVPGRWTVTQQISSAEYIEARAAADQRLAEEEAQERSTKSEEL